MGLKRAIIGAGLYGSDLFRAHAWARFARGRGVILTFHHVRPAPTDGFSPNRLLEITPEFLETTLDTLDALGFELVALDEVPARLAGPERERPFAALTFDDGYRDNRDHAAPILARRGAPWTLFVTRDFALGRGRFWWRELEEAVAALEVVRFKRALAARRTDREKARACSTRSIGALRAGPAGRRCATRPAGSRRRRGVDVTDLARRRLPRFRPARAALAANPGVTLRAHTLSHPICWPKADAPGPAARFVGEARRALESGRSAKPCATSLIRRKSIPARPVRASSKSPAQVRFENRVTTRRHSVFGPWRRHFQRRSRASRVQRPSTRDAGRLRALLFWRLRCFVLNHGTRIAISVCYGCTPVGCPAPPGITYDSRASPVRTRRSRGRRRRRLRRRPGSSIDPGSPELPSRWRSIIHEHDDHDRAEELAGALGHDLVSGGRRAGAAMR